MNNTIVEATDDDAVEALQRAIDRMEHGWRVSGDFNPNDYALVMEAAKSTITRQPAMTGEELRQEIWDVLSEHMNPESADAQAIIDKLVKKFRG